MKNSIVSKRDIADIIKGIGLKEFTVLDVEGYIKSSYKDLWDLLQNRYYGEQYTPRNYLSQQIIRYSKKEDSLIEAHIAFNGIDESSFRRPTEEESKIFNSNYIAVFRLRFE